ncbi:MAG: beta strand repeat-containing protein [Bryobacteraceae bacterium]
MSRLGQNCTITVTFTPQATGARSASVTVTDSAAGSPHAAALSGSGAGIAQVSLSPSALTFASQNVNTTSTAQAVTLSNAGSGALSITSIAITGINAADFSQTNTCGSSVAAGQNCTITVTFTPQATGARSASVSVTDSATGSPHTASLSGTGAGVAQVSLSPSALTFASQNFNTTSTAQAVTLSNAGSGALSITSIAITGTNAADFSQTNTCGSSVAAGQNCTITVTFTPQAAGARSGSVTVPDNAAGSPHAAALSGTGMGVAQVSLTPSSLAFGNQNVKTASAARAITLSKAGSGALAITSIAITGTNAADFSQTSTCGSSVVAGQNCTITVTFTPQAAGARSASVTVTDNAAGSPHAAALSGTGMGVAQVSLTPSSLAFGNQNVKTVSAARAITLSNAGSGALAITSIATTGTNVADFSQTNTCGTSVAAGASCTISVKFTPQAAGTRSASVTVTDGAAGSPHSAPLSGTGIAAAQVSLTPSSLAFGNQKVKASSSARTITLSNAGSAALSITSIAFTGTNTADFSQTNTCGTGVAAGGSCTISVKFTPQAAGARSASLTVTDNAAGSPHRAALSGTGIPITLTPTTVAFGNQRLKTASSARTVSLSNIGTSAVSITRIAFTGTNAADFSQTNTCGTSVAAGGSCTISVKFTPQAAGTRSASLAVTDNAAGSPHTAALSGTGVPVTLTPSTLAFGNQKVKTASTARTITLANIGTATVSITKIAFTGTNAAEFSQTNTCGTSVAAGRNCTISIKFTPQATGTRSASLSVTDNAAGSPHTAALSGTGTP